MIKNYTSSVPAAQSVSFIEQKLQTHGASDIMKRYNPKKELAALCFIIAVEGRQVPFKLPARVEQCEQRLLAERMRGRQRAMLPSARETIRQQAERTAWKILADWVALQLTLIELDQVKFIEIFMSFTYDPATDQTFFERMQATKFKGLLPAKTEST